MDKGTKLALCSAAAYAAFHLTRRQLAKLLFGSKPKKRAIRSAVRRLRKARKVVSRHLLCFSLGGLGAGLVMGAVGAPEGGLSTRLLCLLPAALAGPALRALSINSNSGRLKTALSSVSSLLLGASTVVLLVDAPGGAAAQHLLLAPLTTAACAASTAAAAVLRPPRTRGAGEAYVAGSIVAPLLLVVPAQAVALGFLQPHYPPFLPRPGLALASMAGAATAYSFLLYRRAAAAVCFARHFGRPGSPFLPLVASPSAVSPMSQEAVLRQQQQYLMSDSEGEGEEGDALEGEEGEEEGQGQGRREGEEHGGKEPVVRMADLSFEVKRELELLCLPAHEARIEAVLSRLEAAMLPRSQKPRVWRLGSAAAAAADTDEEDDNERDDRPSPRCVLHSSCRCGAVPALSIEQKQEVIREVQRANQAACRQLEDALTDLEARLTGDDRQDAVELLSDGLLLCLPTLASALLALRTRYVRDRYKADRQAGRVRLAHQRQLERLARLLGFHSSSSDNRSTGAGGAGWNWNPSSSFAHSAAASLPAAMRFEYDLEELYFAHRKGAAAVY